MKIGNEKPVNKTAALVVGSGEHFSYLTNEHNVNSDVPLPVKEVPNDPSLKNLAGMLCGRLKVIGLSATKNARWVCRCSCGTYVLRTSSALKKGRAAPCDNCVLLAVSKRDEYERRTGVRKFIEDFL